MNGVIMMRSKDLERIKVMHQLAMKQITQLEAGKLMHITERQVRKLFKRYKEIGDKGVISRKLGQSSNRQLPQKIKNEALKLIVGKYADFGPTLAAEKLRNIHGITLGVETVRQLMVAHKLWIPNVEKPVKIHPSRKRRDCFGELILIDGSIDFWFEDRGPRCITCVYR